MKNKSFTGRRFEMERLEKIGKSGHADIIIVYGRRRVGKTELIEQFFQKGIIFKFEGIQTDIKSRAQARQYQIDNCLNRLAEYLGNPLLSKVKCESWSEFFKLLDPVIHKQKTVLYFEEIQWLSNYNSEFLAELKPFWDDSWRHEKGLKLVICGSSPSFITGQMMGDRALYSRAQHEFHLKPFNLMEIKDFFRKLGNREVMLAQLTVGGIPEYLKMMKGGSSLLQALCEHSFFSNAYFYHEARRIFVSSLSENKHYRAIVEYLSKIPHAARKDIQSFLKLKSGGTLTTMLDDLENLGFIEKYVPVHLEENSLVARYAVSDEYLNFYYKFIRPAGKKIEGGKFNANPMAGLPASRFQKSLGFCFERWCMKNSGLFAGILGFDKIEYRAGAYFNRQAMKKEPGFQIDLMYVRADHKILICEIKHYYQPADAGKIYRETARKRDLFFLTSNKYRNYTCELVLITTEGLKSRDKENQREYFDHVITYDEIFNRMYW
ncbi:ATP-binding protein [Fibrobacterota bacterium]